MEILILNDGTEVNGHIRESGDGSVIFVYLDGKSIVEGIELFSERERTLKITAMFHGSEKVYEDYTRITAVNSEYGNCNITMKRAVA